ncbi:gliding motility-associated peptidyl-prolyl isomerase GldI [Flavobacterium celericrescens]|uniref:Peptidyl-prolyl cis-trans isomerase n=1 Tax=Flavobacterium celericrescens TaxID=2709780 RepID=A0ABX0IBA1_9FLAO|nr:gliding motility-associated peptidyl-prolyl isomerase GldI [Flavobacterium celericrescens]NHM03902.1 gliding motility-associated peptidyl-prolyl isomerase GldI [Flavobacterium celericrescens]
MKLYLYILIASIGITFTGCSKQQQARKPITHSSGTFIKESIERNKKLVANEEKLIDSIIKNDTLKQYIASNKGYWYKYETKLEESTAFPKRGDIAYFDYEIKDLLSRVIYTKAETKPQIYYVDKENIMMGLRDGIKLMKKGETITFLFPSHMAYGYHGDDKKIGTNEPLICTVTLNDIKLDTQAKN